MKKGALNIIILASWKYGEETEWLFLGCCLCCQGLVLKRLGNSPVPQALVVRLGSKSPLSTNGSAQETFESNSLSPSYH